MLVVLDADDRTCAGNYLREAGQGGIVVQIFVAQALEVLRSGYQTYTVEKTIDGASRSDECSAVFEVVWSGSVGVLIDRLLSLYFYPSVVFAATGNAISMATKAMNALEIVFDTIKMKTIVVKINVISVIYIYPIEAQRGFERSANCLNCCFFCSVLYFGVQSYCYFPYNLCSLPIKFVNQWK